MAERIIKFIYNKRNRRIGAVALFGGLFAKNICKHVAPQDLFFPFYGLPSKDLSLFDARKLLKQCLQDAKDNSTGPFPMVTPFIAKTAEVVSAGFSAFDLGQSKIGFPRTFFCDSVADVAEMNIAMGKVSWLGKRPVVFDKEEECEISLMKNMIYSEDAKLFATARHVYYLKDNFAIYQAVIAPIYTVIGYFLTFHSPKVLFSLSSKPVQMRSILLVSLLGFVTAVVLCKISNAALSRWINRQTDLDAARMSPNYALGGIEVYDKLLETNKSLRVLLGKRGEQMYSENGDVISRWLFDSAGPSFSARKQRLQNLLDASKNNASEKS